MSDVPPYRYSSTSQKGQKKRLSAILALQEIELGMKPSHEEDSLPLDSERLHLNSGGSPSDKLDVLEHYVGEADEVIKCKLSTNLPPCSRTAARADNCGPATHEEKSLYERVQEAVSCRDAQC